MGEVIAKLLIAHKMAVAAEQDGIADEVSDAILLLFECTEKPKGQFYSVVNNTIPEAVTMRSYAEASPCSTTFAVVDADGEVVS